MQDTPVDFCYGTVELSHTELKRALIAIKKHSKVGMFLDVEESFYRGKDTIYTVKLMGPKLRWKQAKTWKLEIGG